MEECSDLSGPLMITQAQETTRDHSAMVSIKAHAISTEFLAERTTLAIHSNQRSHSRLGAGEGTVKRRIHSKQLLLTKPLQRLTKPLQQLLFCYLTLHCFDTHMQWTEYKAVNRNKYFRHCKPWITSIRFLTSNSSFPWLIASIGRFHVFSNFVLGFRPDSP